MPTRRDPARVKAVFTADIVGSTQHAPEETQWQLTSLISALDREVSWILHPEIYRGDSFQGVLASTEEMLRTAILARALMKQQGPKWDLRRSEEHTSELQSRENIVCRLLLEKKN